MSNIKVKITNFNGNHRCNLLFVTMNLKQPYGEVYEIPLALFNRLIRIGHELEQAQKEIKKAAGISPEEVPF